MHKMRSRYRGTRIFCRFACLLFLLILVYGQVYAAGDADFQSRIEWDYDIEQNIFTVYNAAEFFPDQPILRCIVGLYEETGRMFSCGMAVRCGEGEIQVHCTAGEIPATCTIRMFFLDGGYTPLGPTEVYDLVTTEATCTENGYVTVKKADGSYSKVVKVFEAPGHCLNEVLLHAPTDDVTCGTAEQRCENCPYTEQVAVYPECDIARLCMYGDLTGIGKKAEVPITVSFSGAGQEIDCYALLKYQGHTSLAYAKKNYTLKLFKDEAFKQKNKITFFDWNKEHKYILKANYIDPSVCRNLVCADLWSEMVACRENYPIRLDDCSNYGATDGFPMALYLNDIYQGLYTFTLHRDDDLFDMEDGNLDGILVANTAQTDAAFFRASATFDEQSDWEVEYSGLEDNTQWLEDKLNELINFVSTTADTEFKNELHQYLDVDSAIDYLIAIYSMGLTNSGAKNITMATYDNSPLFFSLCDMENAFGLSPTGEQFFEPSHLMPACTDGLWDSATGSLLWDRLLQNYEAEIRARYTALRQEILTAERICGKVSDFLRPISKDFYEADYLLYPDIPQPVSSAQAQIEEYVPQRLLLLDRLLLSGDVY
jgi:hypothetical protein